MKTIYSQVLKKREGNNPDKYVTDKVNLSEHTDNNNDESSGKI